MKRLGRLIMYGLSFGVVLGLGEVHARYIGHYPFTGTSRFWWLLVFAGVLCLTSYGVGLPDRPRTVFSGVVSSFVAVLSGVVLLAVLQLAFGSALLPRYVLVWSVGILVPSILLTILIDAHVRGRSGENDRVVAVVTEEEAQALRHEFSSSPEWPATVAATIGPEAARETDVRRPLAELAKKVGATVVVLNRPAQSDESIVAQTAMLHEEGVRIRTLALFYDEWLAKLPVSELERVSLMFDIGELHNSPYARLRRITDIVVGATGCIFLAAAIPFVTLFDLVANRGTLFYRQQRVGRGGVAFTIWKFRTMQTGADTGDWATPDDPRVTAGGRILRKLYLDELPQVLNVLRGDLSIVGPRPEQPRYVDNLTEKIPFYRLRHLIRPGMTGWAQVKYRYGSSEVDAFEKLQYDFYYLRHQGIVLDLRIVVRTLRAIMDGAGR